MVESQRVKKLLRKKLEKVLELYKDTLDLLI